MIPIRKQAEAIITISRTAISQKRNYWLSGDDRQSPACGLERMSRKPQYQGQYFGLGMDQNNDCGGCDDICSIDLLSALWPYSPVHVCPHYPGTHGAHA
jgi:hypothetical protein